MYHFIMRKTQQKLFTVSINHAKGQLIMGSAPKQRVFAHIINEIIHPSHIPLIVKAQSVLLYLASNLRPCRRFFRNQQHVRMFFLTNRIQVFQKLNGFQVFISTVNICHPFSIIFSVVQIQHRRHCIHTDTVCMVFLNPE